MKVLKYLIALWAAVAVYSLLILFFGPAGFSSYKELLAGREIQKENIKKLGSINSELEDVQNNLLYDSGTIAVYARQLGYGYEDEQFLRIVGLGGLKNPYFSAGTVVKMPETVFISNRIIKICALFTGIAVFALLFALDSWRSFDEH